MQLELEMNVQQNKQLVTSGIERMQFLREDEKAIVQVGPDLLVVNQLAPYSKWEPFKKMISNALEVYHQVANPQAFRRIGLRYINRIETAVPQVEIKDYLRAVPQVPEPVPQLFATWVQRVEIPFETYGGMLALQSGSIQHPEKTGAAFLLDLDFFTTNAELMTMESALPWIEKAHDAIEQAFEACITENTRGLFKEVRNDE